jgi:hypothetical protein
MRKSWLLCVLLSTIAWGQAPQGTAAPTPMAPQAPNGAPQAAPAPAPEVPEDAVVMTITGVCPATPAAAAKPAAAADAKATPAKTATAKKPGDCKTVLTRRDFEKMAGGLAPNITPQLKHQLGAKLPQFIAMSEFARKQGLDKTEAYKQTLKLAQMQILTQQLQRRVQEEADKVTPEQEKEYYSKNPEAYEQFSVDRLFVPRNKQDVSEKADADDAKLTDEQQKAKEAADKAKQEEGEQELTKLADSLRERAAKGEDFMKLQKEAFEAANMKMDSPTVNLPKVRRTGLPPAHAAVFDLKVGEVSPVISDNGGHYVYKVVSKETLPLDQVSQEIHNTLKSQRMKDMMEKYTSSYHVDENEAYFGAPGPQGPMGGRPGPPHMPRPMQVTPTQVQPQTAPPAAQQPPPTKPN